MKDFPSLKNKICIADGIQGTTSFQIRNAKDLEEAKLILNEPFIRLDDVTKHCSDNQKIKDALIKYMNSDNMGEHGFMNRYMFNILKELNIK